MPPRVEPLPSYPADHPAFSGHFPGNPIVPGVLLLDAALHALETNAGPSRIASAKFLRPVAPGEGLQLRSEITSAGALRFSIGNAAGDVASGQVQACANGSAP